MKAFIHFLAVTMLSIPAVAQTNQELLQERLITPMVYSVLMKRGATTPEQRMEAILEACQSGVLGPNDCNDERDRRRRW